MTQLVIKPSASRNAFAAQPNSQGLSHSNRSGKNTGYIRKIQALTLLMLSAKVEGGREASMRSVRMRGTELSSMMAERCKADQTVVDDLKIETAMARDWFHASQSNCGHYQLEAKSGTAKLAIDLDDALCQTVDELMAYMANEPACHSLKKVSKAQASFEDALLPYVINTKGFSASLSAPSLAPCISSLATITEQCGQFYENTEKQWKYQAFIWAFAACGAGAAFFIELILQLFAVEMFDSRGIDSDLRDKLNVNIGKFKLIADSFGVAAAILKPLAQALISNWVGGQMMKSLVGPNASASTLNTPDANHYILVGALPFAIVELMDLLPLLKHSHATQGPAHQDRHMDFLKALTGMQIPSGIYMRNFAAIVGALNHSLVYGNQGKQTVAETMACLAVGQLVSPVIRPVLYVVSALLQIKLTDLATCLHGRAQAGRQHAHALLQIHRMQEAANNPIQVQLQNPQPNPGNVQAEQRDAEPSRNIIDEKINILERDMQPRDTTVEDLVPPHLEGLYICSLTRELMRDPVAVPAFNRIFRYERSAAEEWINRNQSHPTFVTVRISANQPLNADFALKASIEAWLDSEIEKAQEGN